MGHYRFPSNGDFSAINEIFSIPPQHSYLEQNPCTPWSAQKSPGFWAMTILVTDRRKLLILLSSKGAGAWDRSQYVMADLGGRKQLVFDSIFDF